jgi:hypothetical protein
LLMELRLIGGGLKKIQEKNKILMSHFVTSIFEIEIYAVKTYYLVVGINKNAPIAQSVERRAYISVVAGSSPAGSTFYKNSAL